MKRATHDYTKLNGNKIQVVIINDNPLIIEDVNNGQRYIDPIGELKPCRQEQFNDLMTKVYGEY